MHSYLNNRETLDNFYHELVALPTKLASQVATQIDEFRHTLLHCYINLALNTFISIHGVQQESCIAHHLG